MRHLHVKHEPRSCSLLPDRRSRSTHGCVATTWRPSQRPLFRIHLMITTNLGLVNMDNASRRPAATRTNTLLRVSLASPRPLDGSSVKASHSWGDEPSRITLSSMDIHLESLVSSSMEYPCRLLCLVSTAHFLLRKVMGLLRSATSRVPG